MTFQDSGASSNSGRELGQTSGDGEGQGGLACCSPWGLQRAGHDWATEQKQQIATKCLHFLKYLLQITSRNNRK